MGLQDIKVTFVNVNDGIVEVHAESKNNIAICPKCHSITQDIHDYRIQTYEHLYICGKATIIHLVVKRYVCSCDLDHPFDESFLFIRKYQRQTVPFEKYIFELCHKNTIKNVAKLVQMSENKIQRIYNYYAKIQNSEKCKEPFIFLGIDDIAKSKGHKYYTVIYNHETGEVVALIDGRTKEDVVNYITKNFTKEQRERVLAVSLDMSKTYAAAILECFPNAAPVTDRFHISQALHVAVDNARKHIQNKIRKDEGDTKKVFGIRWSILKNQEDLTAKEMSLLEDVCNHYPKLMTCYELKEEFKGEDKIGLLTYGLGEGCDISARNINYYRDGLKLDIIFPDGNAARGIRSNLIGGYNVYNILAAVSAAYALSATEDSIVSGIESLANVPGRVEKINIANAMSPLICVDYAHTDDALKRVLSALRNISVGRLISVFGCGGDRDKGKRPLMGMHSTDIADISIITSDNPRSEDPLSIIREIEAGIKKGLFVDKGKLKDKENGHVYTIEEDRANAIRLALSVASEEDVVLVAGKGHEDYMIVKENRFHFSDKEEILKYYENRI